MFSMHYKELSWYANRINSGAPGSSSFVSIRGASTFSDEGVSPLYVVDGVVVDNIDDISANDIKQIDVMKDAAVFSYLWCPFCKWCNIDYYKIR